MKSQKPLISIGVYLRGYELDPDHISKVLAIKPSEAQRKGGLKPRSKKYIAKIGMWVLKIKSESRPISQMIDAVLGKIGNPPMKLNKIKGVEDAHLDIFLVFDNNEEPLTAELSLTTSQIVKLSKLGLSVCVTVM